jgi:hypothetical protein
MLEGAESGREGEELRPSEEKTRRDRAREKSVRLPIREKLIRSKMGDQRWATNVN